MQTHETSLATWRAGLPVAGGRENESDGGGRAGPSSVSIDISTPEALTTVAGL